MPCPEKHLEMGQWTYNSVTVEVAKKLDVRFRDKSGPSRRRAASLTFTKQLLPLFSGSGPLSLV
jgi:hypothetical protein